MRLRELSFVLVLSLCETASARAQASIFPEWAGRESAILNGEREGLVGDAEALFAQSSETRSDSTFEGVILCHIHLDEPNEARWDAFADPDLRVVLQAGRTRLTAWGPENSRDTYLSFAGLSIRQGTQLSWRVFDRDVTGDEAVETLRLRFDGTWPWVVRGEHAALRCRAVDSALAAQRAEEGQRAATQAIETLMQATPDLTDANLGRSPALPLAQSGIVRIMTYRGTRDPEARELRTRMNAAVVSFDRALRARLSEARRSSPAPNTWVETERGAGIRMTTLACGERAIRDLNLSAEANSDVASYMDSAACIVLLETRGDTHDLQVDVIDDFGATGGHIERRDEHVIVVFPAHIDPRRSLLRVGAPEPHILRLR